MTSLAPESLGALLAAADTEGHNLVRRLVDDWASGANRFNRPGEALFEAVADDDVVVGVCGLNVDPFVGDPRLGRLRHLYVHPQWRRQGVGRQLVAAVLEAAAGCFDVVRLRTGRPEAVALYERVGFEPVAGDAHCTHRFQIDAALPPR